MLIVVICMRKSIRMEGVKFSNLVQLLLFQEYEYDNGRIGTCDTR